MCIDWSKAKYREDEELWHLSLTEEEVTALWCEPTPQQVKCDFLLAESLVEVSSSERLFWRSLGIDIAGTEESYDASYKAVIEKTVQHLQLLMRGAENYLRLFIDLGKVNNSDGGLFI